MKLPKMTRGGYLFLLFILLTISLLPVSGMNLEMKKVTVSDQQVPYRNQIANTAAEPVSEQSVVSSSNSQLAIDQVATDFSNAIEITMAPGGFYNNGSTTFTFDQNTAFREVYFKYLINLTTHVKVTFDSPAGSSFDQNRYEFFGDIYTTNNYESGVAFFDSFQNTLPMSIEYPAQQEGYHYFYIIMNDIIDYEFSPGEEVKLQITIDHYAPGVVRSDQISEDVQSQPFDIISRSEQYLAKTGYLDYQNALVNLGAFNETDPGYARGIGLSVYGMLKSAEYTSRVNSLDDIATANKFLPLIKTANSLFQLANQTLLEPSAGKFFMSPSESGGGNYVAYLQDNAYMIMAMGELFWFGNNIQGTLGPVLNFDPFVMETQRQVILNYTMSMFKNSTGDYRERISITGYLDNGNNYFDAGDATSFFQNDINNLESYAILAEQIFWSDYLLFPTDVNELTDIINYVLANMTTTTVSGASISSEGIFLDWYNSTSTSNSQTASLLGNALMLSHLSSYTSEFGFITIDSISTQINQTLQYISDIADNVLSSFSAISSGSNLLFSQINTIDSTKNVPILTIIDNSVMVFALNRIAGSWIFQSTQTSNANQQAIIRSWKQRSILGMNNIVSTFFDDADGYFFPQYDVVSQKYTINDKSVSTNLLMANTFVQAPLADLFPIQMKVLQQDDIPVGELGQVSLALSQFQTGNTWAWYDPFKPFDADIKISIPEFDYEITSTVALSTGFDQGDVVVPFFYDVTVRGSYDIIIELSTEGVVLLAKTVTLTARGEARPEFTPQVFSIADTSFTTDIGFVDETGDALSSLQVKGSLGLPISDSESQFGNKYIQIGRTDTSGKLELTFNTGNLVQDGLLNLTELYNQSPIPNFVELQLYLNLTNADSFDLVTREYIIDVRVKLARVSLRTSPSILEITQGTTDSFTFTVTALDMDQEPISNADIAYSVSEIPTIKNFVHTDSDGEATITFRDSDLFALSKLAIVQNKDKVVSEGQELAIVNATVNLSFTKQLYPNRTLSRNLNILPNDLIITANPVVLSTKEANIFQRDVSPVEIEVATSDLFSQVINSYVHLEWAKNSDNANSYTDLTSLGVHIAPYTFDLDPTKLPAGEYQLLIFAEKDGITTTEVIDFSQPNLNQYKLDQVEVISKPAIVQRTIIIESSTLEDVLLSAVSLFGAFIALKALNFGKEGLLKITGFYKECPHCRTLLRGNLLVCSGCGRETVFRKNKSSKDNPPIDPENEEPMK